MHVRLVLLLLGLPREARAADASGPGRSIADEVAAAWREREAARAEGATGDDGRRGDRLRFHLAALFEAGAKASTGTADADAAWGLFEVDVKEGSPVVTADTSISVEGRGTRPVWMDAVATVLVAAAAARDAGTLALVAVDGRTGRVDGIVQQRGGRQDVRLEQHRGEDVSGTATSRMPLYWITSHGGRTADEAVAEVASGPRRRRSCPLMVVSAWVVSTIV